MENNSQLVELVRNKFREFYNFDDANIQNNTGFDVEYPMMDDDVL